MEKERLTGYFEKLGLAMTDNQAEQFLLYNDLLLEWNSFMNLTAITEPQDIMIKHFADSCAPLFTEGVSFDKEAGLIDVGTGAGFPGLPLKIMCPELKVTLLDSLGKRVKFLNEVISRLELNGITAIHSRAEDGAHDKKLREQFGVVVSRAVAGMNILAEYCLPFVKNGGSFIAYKSEEFLSDAPGSERDACLNALKILGSDKPEVVEYTLPGTDYRRCLAVIRKTGPTPAKYPRKAGTPKSSPL
ncbi:MAG: 16S rRNA (guanine(527)-N(7))-methyltransferase RsmG [Lachnospiraceae bacterium]|nr:16S rRNA (guanine(527)-N(7))-methyltransferase RsmG [Lachnospiraceae bacterium]